MALILLCGKSFFENVILYIIRNLWTVILNFKKIFLRRLCDVDPDLLLLLSRVLQPIKMAIIKEKEKEVLERM